MYRWMQAVATITISCMAGLVVITILAFGLLPTIFTGFAKASDIQLTAESIKLMGENFEKVLEGQNKARIRAVDAEIMQVQERKCKNEKTSPRNDEAISMARSKIIELMHEYEDLTNGKPYTLLTCDQL